MALTKISTGVIADEFQTVAEPGAASAMTIDWNSAQIFRFTPVTSATTFTFTDFTAGMVKVLVLTGGGGGTLVFPSTASSLGGEFDGASGVKNFVQIICTKDGASPEFFYTISQPAS